MDRNHGQVVGTTIGIRFRRRDVAVHVKEAPSPVQ